MKEYTVNFLIWWYLFKVKNAFYFARFWIVFFLVYTRTLPMIKNLTRPLYGDKSRGGRFIGLFIRGWWVVFGGAISLILSIPFMLFVVIIVILPILPIIQLIRIF